MPKARVLTRSMAKPSGTSKSGTGHESTNSNDSTAALPGRPRTAGGDRGILRRLRLGRIFGFSHGIEANTASSPSDGAGADAGMAFKAQGIFRTNSVQTPTTENDLLAGAAQLPPPLLPAGMFPHASVDRDRDQMPQTLNTAQYMQNGDPADARKSRYSILSRRSSAPDVTDIARRLSRYSVSTRLEPATRADALLRAPLDGSYAADITESPLDSLNDSQEYTMAASYSELEHPSDDEYLVDLLPAKPVNSADTACSKRETADFPNGLNSTCASGPDALTETTQAALRSAAMQHPPLPPASANSASNSAGSAQLISPRSSSSAKVGVTASSAQCSHDSSPPKDTAPLLLESLGVQGCRSMQNGRGISSMRSTGSNARESPTTHRSPPPRTDTATTKLSDSAVLSAATDFGASIRPKAVRSSGSHGHANTTGGGVDRSRSNASLAPQTDADAPGTSGKLNSTCIGATNSGPELPPLPPKDAHAGQASPFMAVACDLVAPVGASTMLMGSVKARGEKKHMLQSLGAQAALSKPLPPPPQEQQRQSQPPTPTSAGLLPMPLLSPASSPPLPPLPAEQQCALPLRRHRHSSPTSDVNALREPLTEAGQQPAARTQPTAERVGLLGKRGQSSLPVHARPKSLYERSARREPLVSATEPPPLEARPSSSISAAKAFLTMMSSGRDYSPMNASLGTSELTIATKCSQRHFSCSPSGGSSPLLMPSSAPPASIRADHRSSGLRDPGTNERLAGAAANRSGCEGGVESSEKDNEGASSTGIIGNRSLRTRSKFATVGIRRASTYVWSRSSVFMRALSSTDELSNYQQQSHSSWEVADVELTSAKAADTAETQSVGRVNSSASDQIEPAAGDILPIPATQPTTRKSPAAMRLHAARELVITEKNFVDNMFVIKKVWMEPVFSSANSPKPIIPYQTARVIFFGIAALHSHASQFYREMDFALGSFERNSSLSDSDSDDGMRIGMLFRTGDRHWNDFIAYVRNYGTAVSCLNQLQDYKPYLRYHEECMLQKRTNRQSLKDLLMLPIQRITRYTLLLKNILKHTPAVHGDHIELCRAVKNVTHFASIVNECRRKQEEMHRLIEIFRTIELCPPLPHSDSRSFVTEFIVRELISRQPTRLLLFSDMLIVTQAPAQTKVDAAGQIDAVVEWTYYGSAFLDQAEVQNSDESTNTLITILSLNRGSGAADDSSAGRRSLPASPQSPTRDRAAGAHGYAQMNSQPSASDTNGSGESHSGSTAGSSLSSNGHMQDGATASDPGAHDAGSKKRKSRKGILRAGSRDSIPDHISGLSHSTFPSPVPPPAQPERGPSWFNRSSSNTAADVTIDSTQQSVQQQRPKTASGQPGPSPSALSAGSLSSGAGAMLADPAMPSLPPALEAPGEFAGIPGMSHHGPDIAPPKPVQLTLVMQHATSAARKQFVKALRDTATKHMFKLSRSEPDIAADISSTDASSSDVLSLHPL